MQLTSALVAVAGLATLAAANPTSKRAAFPNFLAVSSQQVESHTYTQSSTFQSAANVQTVGVYVCSDANGQGNCAYVLNIPGACTSLTNTPFNDVISFVDPTGGNGTPNASCTVFIDENCTGRSEVISSPYGNLAVTGDPSFNDNISSFRCVVAT